MVEQYYSAKWKIMQAFDKGKLPKDINCLGVKRETIYAYYQEWKRVLIVSSTINIYIE